MSRQRKGDWNGKVKKGRNHDRCALPLPLAGEGWGGGVAAAVLTSPRLRGEVDAQRASGEGVQAYQLARNVWKEPLTLTLSP